MVNSEKRRRSLSEVRSALHGRLLARRPEIEQAIATRAYGVSDPVEAADPDYLEGLRDALPTALDYVYTVLERGEERAPPIPAGLLTQARLAARAGISLDIVLRRYLTGYTLLCDFLIEAADKEELEAVTLQPLIRAHGALFDRLLAAITQEHARGFLDRPRSSEQRRAEQLERLLAGEPVDTSRFAYDFHAYHLGLIASGPAAAEAVEGWVGSLDCRLLRVVRDETTVWAWFGGRRPLDSAKLSSLIGAAWPQGPSLALGEPACGIHGWRHTHRQARAALAIAHAGRPGITRYTDVALLASIVQDDLLATSLRQLYLVPLSQERDGGVALRETLRAYFETERNVSSAAIVLGVSRKTVVNRLRTIEARLNRPLGSCAVELEAALRLDELMRLDLPPDYTHCPRPEAKMVSV